MLKHLEIMRDKLTRTREKWAKLMDGLEIDNGFRLVETKTTQNGDCRLCEEHFLNEQLISYYWIGDLGSSHCKWLINFCKSCDEWNKSRPKYRKRRHRSGEEHMAEIRENGERVRRNIRSRHYDDHPTTEHADGTTTPYHHGGNWGHW